MGNPGFGIGVQYGKFYLFFRRIEVDKKIVHFIDNFFYSGIAAIDFVDGHDNGQLFGKCLLDNKTGLWQRAFARIHEQEHSIDQIEAPFHFAAEIDVTGRVNDVNLDIAIPDGRVFCHDGNTALPFEIH